MPVYKVAKVWGREEWIVNCNRYCGKRLTLFKGWQCSLHMHPIKDETFWVESGRVLFQLHDALRIMEPGDHVRILPGTWHRFSGIRHSIIFEFSTTHDDADVVRREESKRFDTDHYDV